MPFNNIKKFCNPLEYQNYNIDIYLKKKSEDLCFLYLFLLKIYRYEPSLITYIQEILQRLKIQGTLDKLDFIQKTLNNQRLFHNQPNRGFITIYNVIPSKLELKLNIFYNKLLKLIRYNNNFNCVIYTYFIKVTKIVSQKNYYALHNNYFFFSKGCHWYEFKFVTLHKDYILIINEIIGYCYFIDAKEYSYSIFEVLKRIHPNLEYYYCDRGEYSFNTLTEYETGVLNKIKEQTKYFYNIN